MEIRVIQTDGKASLVEAVIGGKVARRYVPTHLVRSDNEIELSDFLNGVEYGLPFREIIVPAKVEAQEIEDAFHNAGIWTYEDLQASARQAIGALQSIYQVSLGNILQSAQNHLMQEAEKSVPKKRKTSKKEEENG